MDQEEQDLETAIQIDEAEAAQATAVPQLEVGLTAFGKIGINIRDANGNAVGYVIDNPGEAWQIAGHINAIATMMVQAYYAQAQMEKEMMQKVMNNQKLVVPGGK